jgi:hypothetical protein
MSLGRRGGMSVADGWRVATWTIRSFETALKPVCCKCGGVPRLNTDGAASCRDATRP